MMGMPFVLLLYFLLFPHVAYGQQVNSCATLSVGCYQQWVQEFSGIVTSKISDIDNDGKVDLIDFEYWRRGAIHPPFVSQTPTQTPLPTPASTSTPTPSIQPSPTSPLALSPTPTFTPTPSPLPTLTNPPPISPTPTLVLNTNLFCSSATTLETLVSCITSHFGPYVIPSESNQTDWKDVITKMLNGQCDFTPTGTLASVYQIRTFTDSSNGKNYCLAMEIKDTNPADGKVDYGWGTFIVNNLSSREINHSAPHAVSDIGTQDEAIRLFKSTNSRTFLMAGARRTIGTSSCQTNLGFSASDASHNIDHFFFAATQGLDTWYQTQALSWWQIQWHGMAATTCPGVNAYIAHGFSSAPPADSKTVRLKNNMLKYHPAWTVTVTGESPSCSLHATDNTQGRFLNGVSRTNSCQTRASNYLYKFIHIEQQPNFRNANDWNQAILDSFP